ncbi:hypothetical protein J2X46_000881 [Nocardioides sp. BE266]|uniref:hypothetical protein n=1 Tax=Nocardioides sp. BE266 TaxID=2817725 RepID=UPI0028585629|nr:hypothetical protein [Nocardioides sp. BE266]MDR7251905.1 hypothetical protein [Nocardioides sp. BE266]
MTAEEAPSTDASGGRQTDSPEGRTYLLEGVLGSVLILGPAICVGVAMDARWGSIAEWVAGLATVAAFLAAVLAARFAARALEIEQDRERDRQNAIIREQAVLVAAWIEVDYIKSLAGARVHAKTMTCILRNASPVPVHDVEVRVLLDAADGVGRKLIGTVKLATLPPSTDPISERIAPFQRTDPIAAVRERADVPALRCSMDFTDSAGTRWFRGANGELEIDQDYDPLKQGGA